MSHRSKYQQLPTEAINPATLGIDKASSADIIELMLNDDRKVLAAVQREKPRIAIGVDIIVEALRKGGRVIFVGAGTSGRLGVVESAEMPTTFGTDPDSIQAVMAGGKNAFLHTKEGAEDSYEDGARAHHAAEADEEGRRHRRVGERHDAVRAAAGSPARARRARKSSSSPATRGPSCRRSSISRSRRRSALR